MILDFKDIIRVCPIRFCFYMYVLNSPACMRERNVWVEIVKFIGGNKIEYQ